jgi:hypothetical protein
MGTHHFASKFDPPPRQKESTSSRRKHHAKLPIFQKIILSLSIMREAIETYTRPSIEDDMDGKKKKQYYEDNYNDLPWKCSFGTSHDDGIWLNQSDTPGLVMSSMVWLLIGE